MKINAFLIVVFQFCVLGLDAANILFFFFPTYSHIRGSLNVASELASRGHTVWNALTTQLANDKRLQVPGVKIVRYDTVDVHDFDKLLVDPMVDGYFEGGTAPFLFDVFYQIVCNIVNDTHLYDDLKNLNLDLIIYDVLPLGRMLTVFAHKLDVPFIYMGAAFDPVRSRSPFVLSAFPYPILPLTEKMNFLERVMNSLLITVYHFNDPFTSRNALATFAPERPFITMEELVAKASMWIIDMDPFLHYPQALLPNVKLVGSLSSSKPKTLPQVYSKFMDEAKEGAVIVSFGSNVKKLPDAIFERLISSFAQTKYKYIFRSPRKIDVGDNIMLTDWMPQADLLAHPNTKLFITHCGQNGQNEASLNGVPMIGFPIFAEQPYNAARLQHQGFGIKMDLKTFAVDDLIANINEIIQNSSYSARCKKAAEITKTLRVRDPTAEAVFWVDHVIKYGDEHLRSYCQDMPQYQYLNLDVIGLLVFILHLSFFLMWKLSCFCLRKCFCRGQKIKVE